MNVVDSDSPLQLKITHNLAVIAALTESLAASIFPVPEEGPHDISTVPTTRTPESSVTESPTAFISSSSEDGLPTIGTASATQAPEPVTIETHFDFLGLPLELRRLIYGYVYIIDSGELQAPGYILGKLPPHLSCNLHLVSRSMFDETIAFVRSQADWRFDMTFGMNPPREFFESGAIDKALRFPSRSRQLYLTLMLRNPVRLNELVDTLLMCIFYALKYGRPGYTALISLCTSQHEPLEIVRKNHCSEFIDSDFVCFYVSDRTIEATATGNLSHCVQDELQQALYGFQENQKTDTGE